MDIIAWTCLSMQIPANTCTYPNSDYKTAFHLFANTKIDYPHFSSLK